MQYLRFDSIIFVLFYEFKSGLSTLVAVAVIANWRLLIRIIVLGHVTNVLSGVRVLIQRPERSDESDVFGQIL